MAAATPAPELMRDMRIAILCEAWNYSTNRVGKVPPADSKNRPALARLWFAAHATIERRQRTRTFRYSGLKFGVCYIGKQLCVLDIHTRTVLVRPPTSMVALSQLLGNTTNSNSQGFQ